jgi:hypothetical protein
MAFYHTDTARTWRWRQRFNLWTMIYIYRYLGSYTTYAHVHIHLHGIRTYVHIPCTRPTLGTLNEGFYATNLSVIKKLPWVVSSEFGETFLDRIQLNVGTSFGHNLGTDKTFIRAKFLTVVPLYPRIGWDKFFSAAIGRNSAHNSRGRCYDHNFLRFLPIFGEKMAFFSKTDVMITIFAKTNSSFSKKRKKFR